MDVNGTRFHLLLGAGDWARCTDEDGQVLTGLLQPPEQRPDLPVAYHERQQALTLRPRLFQFRAAAKNRAPRFADRRGAARDRFGNWYWISADRRELLVNSVGTQTTSHFWSACDGVRCALQPGFGQFHPRTPEPPPEQLEFSGLAVTVDHYLVVGLLRPAGLLLFDLHASGPPRQMLWPESLKFAPLDMVARPGGGVWILERDLNDPQHPVRYWALDRHFNVERRDQLEEPLSREQTSDFLTLCPDGSILPRTQPRQTFPGGITLDAASPVAALDAIAIEALPDDTVLILESDPHESFSLLYHYDFGRQLGDAVSLDVAAKVVEATERKKFKLLAHDFAFVPEHQDEDDGLIPDRLFVVDSQGDQAFACDILQQGEQLQLEPLNEFLPLRLFGGRGLVAAGTQPYYDSVDRWMPLIAQRRPRYEDEATLLTEPFDSARPNCVWHRLLLDACLPPETHVEILSRAAEEKDALMFASWQHEPDFYLRRTGSELPFLGDKVSPDSLRQGRGTWELGLQRARGRFLQLKLRLSGDGRTSPRLHALRAYYPRFSYLENYLPAVYREDEPSASFLDRFLANLEGVYTTIEDRIAAAQVLFDWRSAPPEALDWLASWFGLVLDPAWEDGRRRLLIRYAMVLFQYRGTIPGLQIALRLALDQCADESIFTEPFASERPHGIRIIESFRTRRVSRLALGDTTEMDEDFNVSPAATTVTRWQDFLRGRYHNIAALQAAHGINDFAAAELPKETPTRAAVQQDWQDFTDIVQAMHATAHRFTVLLPLPPQYRTNRAEQQRRRTLATRVVEVEKPAHTTFEVKFYWALFRAGAVRLGVDTVLDQGSRAPELLPPLVLDQSYLSESWLAPGYPQNVAERPILGHTQEYRL